MVKKIAAIALLFTLLYFMMAATTLAQPQTVSPGVRKGDTFTYNVKGLWSSSDPNATMAEDIRQMNMTEYFKVEVTDVSGSEVTLHTIWRFTNGTEISGDTTRNLDTGMAVSGTSVFWAIYGRNLNVGDRIHPMGIDQLTVNASQIKTYVNMQREINRFTVIGQFESNDSSRTFSDNMIVQFDKETGMLVELYDVQIYTNPAYTQTIIWVLTDTNAFTASTSEFPIEILAVAVSIVAVALVVALIAFKKRTKKTRKRRSYQR
ncbi:hypothetical protein G4O51_06110 [Candidatus Bathyarchaeota archaeon A05DMB-2]|nr:hypothetical protein [Candidatus Bathyarchaeota archaeon A05DMB-2]